MNGHLFSRSSLKQLIFLLFLLVGSSLMVNRDKFRKCSQSSFCRRHRGLTKGHGLNYVLDVSKIKINGAIATIPLNEMLSDTNYILNLTLYKDDILRFVVEEAQKFTQFDRHAVPHVLVEENSILQDWNSFDPNDNTLFMNSGKVRLFSNPFILEYYKNDELLLKINQNNLFYFEYLRPRSRNSDLRDASDNHPDLHNEEVDKLRVVESSETLGKSFIEDIKASTVDISTIRNGEYDFSKFEKYQSESKIDFDDCWEESFDENTDSKVRGPESVGLDITFYKTEFLYGLAEHTLAMNLPSTLGSGINRDPIRLYNSDIFEYELDSEMSLYGAVPLVYSHEKNFTLGMFWLNSAETWVDIERKPEKNIIRSIINNAIWNKPSGDPSIETHWMSESGNIDFFIFASSNPAGAFDKYRTLTGGSFLPPETTLGYHQCRWNYNNQDDVLSVNQGFLDNEIPMDFIWLDIEYTDNKKYFTWHPEHFADPKGMVSNLTESGRKLVVIIDPHIKISNGYHIHDQSVKNNYYVKNPQGNDYKGYCWPGDSNYLDFLNPHTRSWWAGLYSYENFVGTSKDVFIWNDMNEPSVFNGPEVTMPKDQVHFGGIESRHIHNIYGHLMIMATYEGLILRNKPLNNIKNLLEGEDSENNLKHNSVANEIVANSDNEDFNLLRPFLLSRSFFSGSQRFGSFWTGDNKASWDHLKVSVPMLLSMGICGLPFSGADVGGFFGDTPAELFTRWYQVGAWYPFFRGHSHIETKRREPWLFGEPYTSIIRDSIRRRYALLPYIYTQFYYASKSLMPIMRPLFVEFSEDSNTFSMDNQFMFGPAFIVHPVVEENKYSLKTYLPQGKWYNYYTSESFIGPIKVVSAAPLHIIPTYLRGGQIVVLKERSRRSIQAMKNDPYTILIALDPDMNAASEIYIDDGVSMQYKNENYRLNRLEYKKTDNYHIISSKKISGSYLNPNQVLNKIIIWGLSDTPSSVTLLQTLEENKESSAKKIDLEFNVENKSECKVIVIRNPNCTFQDDWEIYIKF